VRIKLYLDEDVDISLGKALKQKGIDAFTTVVFRIKLAFFF